MNVGIGAKALTNSDTEFARDCGGRLCISGTEGGQSSQGTPVESIKKCWKTALSPLKTC
jgi:hypothetical protein